uniref:Archaemetzincin n=1 Tax=Archaeoglobus fulgidus TaxID=2234 RepID=A0A7C3MC02_ARCFL
MKIYIKPVSTNRYTVMILQKKLPEVFEAEVLVLSPMDIGLKCYNPLRGQYNSTCLIRRLPLLKITLGVTGKDLYATGMNFVFGEAELGGARAVLSTFRLITPDTELYEERVVKEATHEIGHVLGLKHCENDCVMKFSNSVKEVDEKPVSFCSDCASKIKLR